MQAKAPLFSSFLGPPPVSSRRPLFDGGAVDCRASRFEKCLASVGGSKTRGLDFLLGYPGSSVCSTVPGSGWVTIARQTEDILVRDGSLQLVLCLYRLVPEKKATLYRPYTEVGLDKYSHDAKPPYTLFV
ncbi:hypothetical protein NXS19_007268 [Fusarium pseudograminearum]|nr:hypothetical protein NXS19_007268 [Fusarium pseudograminearum]